MAARCRETLTSAATAFEGELEIARMLGGICREGRVYSVANNFRRLKDLGFETRADLARFFEFLPALVEVTAYDLDEIARLLNAVEPPLAGPSGYDVPALKRIARAWMDDMHEYCNVANSLSHLDPAQTGFMRRLRTFRQANAWLRHNFGPNDRFDYVSPIAGRTIFTSLRHAPDGRQVYAVCHMEGTPMEAVDPLDLLPGLGRDGWSVGLRTPGIAKSYAGGPVALHDSTGLLFERGG